MFYEAIYGDNTLILGEHALLLSHEMPSEMNLQLRKKLFERFIKTSESKGVMVSCMAVGFLILVAILDAIMEFSNQSLSRIHIIKKNTHQFIIKR